MESGSMAAPRPAGDAPQGSAHGEKGLKSGAIGYVSNIVIGVASTAPGYSLAATLGFVVAVPGVGLSRAGGAARLVRPDAVHRRRYNYMNRADPDCGTTFAWVTRAIGPYSGWIGGWAIIVADIIVMANLAQIAGHLHLPALRLADGGRHDWAVTSRGRVDRGHDVDLRMASSNAATQHACSRRRSSSSCCSPSWRWSRCRHRRADGSPTLAGSTRSTSRAPPRSSTACCLASSSTGGGTAGSRSTRSPRTPHGPGKAAVISTILLVLIYVIVSFAAQAYGGKKLLVDNADDVLSVLAQRSSARPGQDPHHRGAQLGGRLDADDDPAHRAHELSMAR